MRLASRKGKRARLQIGAAWRRKRTLAVLLATALLLSVFPVWMVFADPAEGGSISGYVWLDENGDGKRPAEEAPVEAPVEPVEETPVEETPAEETPAEETPVEETPIEETPAEEAPVEETPIEETPAEETPIETPVEEMPAEETPIETPAETPVEIAEDVPVEAPVEAVEDVPVETPAESVEDVPAETPVEAPAETPVEPVEEEAPVETPVEAEEPVIGHTVYLYDANKPKKPVDETVTGENGEYIFKGLKPGTYTVSVPLSDGENTYVLAAELPGGFTVQAETGGLLKKNAAPNAVSAALVITEESESHEDISVGLTLAKAAPTPEGEPTPDDAPSPEDTGGDRMLKSVVNGYSSDLADFIRDGGIVIKEMNGTVIYPDVNPIVHVGDSYIIELTFNEINTEQFKYIKDDMLTYVPGVLTYELPEYFQIYEAASGKAYDKNGNDLGDYSIDADGNVAVWFGDATDPGGQGVNLIEYYSDFEFVLKLEAEFISTGDETSVKIEFGDDVLIDIGVDKTPSLSVTKKAGIHYGDPDGGYDVDYDPATGNIRYTVTVTAHSGPLDNIVLTDVIKISPSYGETIGNLIDDSLSIIENVKVEWNSSSKNDLSATMSTDSYTDPYYNITYTIPLTGVSLAAGETATVTYYVHIDDKLIYRDEPSVRYDVHNEVTATGKSNNESVPEKKASANAFIYNSFGSKSGEFAENGNIEWWVEIGNGAADLSGALITDTIGDGHELIPNTMKIWLYGAGYDTIQYFEGAAAIAQTSTGFTYTVPAAAQLNNRTVRLVRFVYETQITEFDRSDGYKNEVSLNYKEHDYDYDYTVGEFLPGFTKTGALHGNREQDYIEYEIEIHVPAVQAGSWIVIVDELTLAGNAGTVSNKPDKNDMTVTIKDPSGNPITTPNWDWTLIYGDDANFSDEFTEDGISVSANTWVLYFNAPLTPQGGPTWSGGWGNWNIDQNSIVTITYKIPLNAEVLTGTHRGKTLAAALNYADIKNHAEILWAGIGDDAIVSKPISKSGVKTYKKGTTWLNEGDPGFDEDEFYAAANENKGFYYTVNLNPKLAPDGEWPVFSDNFDSNLKLIQAGEQTVVIQDIAPDGGVQTYSVDLFSAGAGLFADGELSFDFSNVLSGQNSVPVGTWNASGHRFYVKYRLVFKDSYTPEPGKTEEFENTASVEIKLDDNDLTYKAEAVVEYGRPIVDKKMTAAGGSIVDVRIVINPDGKTLAEDAGGFTVVDAMGPSLSFVSLSEIYVTIGDSGKIAYDNPIYKPTDNSITMEFPDSTKIVIEYEARVTGMPGTNVNITNTVSISGYGDYSDEESWGFDVEEVKLQAGYTEAHFYLLKTDKATDARLPGAVFALYNYGYYADFSEAALPAGLTAADKIVDSNGKASETGEYYYLTYGITNETGLITFDNRYINPGDTFLLVEVKAPAGYMKLNDPILIWIHKDNTAQPEGTKVVYHTSEFKVTNETGVLFPESGGAGSGAYMIGGAALMVLAAGVLLIRRNKLPRSRIPG